MNSLCSKLLELTVVGFLLVSVAGCGEKRVLGAKPDGPSFLISDLKKSGANEIVTIKGVLVEKCPVAGCWFYLRDKTATVRVDTKAAGFVIVGIPLQTELTVSGMRSPGGESGFEATGLEY